MGRPERRAGAIRFDVLKARARRVFAQQLQSLAGNPQECAVRFIGLQRFLRLLAADHPELTAVIDASMAAPQQGERQVGAQHPLDCTDLFAQARAQGDRCIEQWDVRCVVRLVHCFPQCIGRRQPPHHAIC